MRPPRASEVAGSLAARLGVLNRATGQMFHSIQIRAQALCSAVLYEFRK